MSETPRVMGVDTSLRSTGIGVVEAIGSRLVPVAVDTIGTPASRPLSECLLRLSDGIAHALETHRPTAVSIEGIFFCRNVRTALALGEARGVVIACCARQRVPTFEYEPRRVKQAVTGVGSATKEQVQRMIMTLLSLSREPGEDECDALAIAICHLHNHSRPAVLMPKAL